MISHCVQKNDCFLNHFFIYILNPHLFPDDKQTCRIYKNF